MPPPPVTLTFDLLTFKVVFESRVTWATYVPNSRRRPERHRQTDRQTSDVRQHHRLMSRLGGGVIIKEAIM